MKGSTKMLANRVAVVTGAGRGIGREVALLLAREGARVVVNDLGGKEDGTGASRGPAEEVAKEIREAGGEAVASYESVATSQGAEAIVRAARESFGRIDIVHTVAGILRDRIFHKMSEEEWDAVLTVHLKGTFNVCRAAAPHFREQEYGRIVTYTSTSGLIGNVGQTNYGAAKLGIVGLTRNMALDLRRFKVTANSISPFAWTRLIGTI
ncbi:MAG: SDR family NAD(P)-dependent oxidoreductase, partial [Thermoplasmata archaeon]